MSLEKPRIAFISTMEAVPWGGSEELWSRTALKLVAEGFRVSASVIDWSPLHKRVLNLMEAGVDVWLRPARYSIWDRAWSRITSRGQSVTAREVERLLSAKPAALVVLSSGGPFPAVELPELCIARRLPFVTIGQANSEGWWIEDAYAARYREALPQARRCYFVSNANRRLAETQIGRALCNAEVVFNPVNVEFQASPPWPPISRNEELQLACVGRLHPPSKGQDVLLEALAGPVWAGRAWHLNLYGDGTMRNTLERMVQRLGLSERVTFGGHVAAAQIWAINHALIMPSRYEGLPLAVVEAMLCARAVIATDVAGHAEVIQDGLTGFLADSPTVPSVSKALERLWDRRAELEEIGKAAALRIRQLVPADAARVFAEKIKQWALVPREYEAKRDA
jgi:glycosyltransferase involved in cell wall biosynthesis